MGDQALALRAMKKIKTLQAEVAEYEEAIDNLKQVVALNLPLGETQIDDVDDDGFVQSRLKATIYQARMFNEAYGKQRHPDLWEKAAVTTRVLTSAVAKRALSEQEYALFQKPSEKISVKVEVVDD